MYQLSTVTLAVLLAVALPARAEILFEGIFAIERDGVRVGYIIQRYEIDRAVKIRKVSTYKRERSRSGGPESFEITRSLSALDFTPVEFSRRSVTPGSDETIKAHFKGKTKINVHAFFGKGAKIERTDTMRVPFGSFLGAFGYYVADISRLTAGKNKSYIAFSESEGRYSEGRLRLDGKKTASGVTVYQVQDFFEGEDIESFVFADGSPVGSRNAKVNAEAYLVHEREEAIQGFEFPQKDLIKVFGHLPEGQKNPVVAGGNKVDVKNLIEDFPVARPTVQELIIHPDIKVPAHSRRNR